MGELLRAASFRTELFLAQCQVATRRAGVGAASLKRHGFAESVAYLGSRARLARLGERGPTPHGDAFLPPARATNAYRAAERARLPEARSRRGGACTPNGSAIRFCGLLLACHRQSARYSGAFRSTLDWA